MEAKLEVLLMVALAIFALPHRGRARPQSILPIADLIERPNLQVHPKNEITIYDLTSDTLNEVNGPPLPGSSTKKDINLQFPDMALHRPPSVVPFFSGTPLPPFREGPSSSFPSGPSTSHTNGPGPPFVEGSQTSFQEQLSTSFSESSPASSGFSDDVTLQFPAEAPHGSHSIVSGGPPSFFSGTPLPPFQRRPSLSFSPKPPTSLGVGANPALFSLGERNAFPREPVNSSPEIPMGSLQPPSPNVKYGFPSPHPEDIQGQLPITSSIQVNFRAAPVSPSSSGIDLPSVSSIHHEKSPVGSSDYVVGKDDVHLTHPGFHNSNSFSPSEQDSTFILTKTTRKEGLGIPGVGDNLNPSLEPEVIHTAPEPSLSTDTTVADATFLEAHVDDTQDTAQFSVSGSIPFNENGHSPPTDFNYTTSADYLPDYDYVADIPISGTPVDDGNQNSAWEGDQDTSNIQGNVNMEEIMSLLTLGLLSANQQSMSQGSASSSQSENSFRQLFNLLTLGLFDRNQSGENPFREILSVLTLGLIDNRNQGKSGETPRGLDLSSMELGAERIRGLTQMLSSGLQEIMRDASSDIEFAQDEFEFVGQQNVQQVIDNIRQAGTTLGEIGKTTYHTLLQKKDAISKLLMRVVENFGSFLNSYVRNTFQKVGLTARTFGTFLRDFKEALINSLIAKGEAIRDLASGTLGTVGEAVTDLTSVAQRAAEDNIRAVTGSDVR